ncbi:hypothetical protein [Hymenobacter montanus]|uniref:hypothetical protein n=1 Tax=Hymenobacter montanus TaxID=2771359 RepID=UPI001F0A3554|nr:hypothetical protein [Hymenobacter montanus]
MSSDIPSPPRNQADNAPGTAAPAVVAPTDSTAAALFAGAEKPIRRIVIFYKDGSFADYHPE